MTQRLDLMKAAPEVYKSFHESDRLLRKGPLGEKVRELVKIRASQLNGCVLCVDMHTHEARSLGETDDRLFQLVVWRESGLFDPAERAALAYTEAATGLGEGGVDDAVWDEVARHFGEEELGALVAQVALINLLNRIGVPLRIAPPVRST